VACVSGLCQWLVSVACVSGLCQRLRLVENESMATSILLVDDDPSLLRVLKRSLKASGFEVRGVQGGQEAIEELDKRSFDILLTDLAMPEVDGMALMQHAHQGNRVRATIMITGDGSVPLAVKAMRAGASDFITKPIDTEALENVLRRAIGDEEHNVRSAILQWRDTYAPHIIGEDPSLLDIFGIIERVADTDCNVLITGPSGTGKELLARAVHDASQRCNHPFVAVNCAAIPKELIESEIFGHTKGAFTGATEKREGKFQVADRGSLFLDEIGEMEMSLQGKFLRVIQDKEVTAVGDSRPIRVDVRIVAATNQNIETRCSEGLFREDLYYRLNVIPIEVPSLKERPGDIVPLAEHFVGHCSRRHNRRFSGLNPAVRDIFQNYAWPGNIRELQNLIERIVILKRGDGLISAEDLPRNMTGDKASNRIDSLVLPDNGIDIKTTLEQIETRLTLDALKKAEGNKARAAELLGLKRTTLIERLKRLGLTEVP
jgi:DNA-binding NtrC family response regulator